MDSVEKLTSAITLVEEARGVPLSASCVVHRAEMLEILDDAVKLFRRILNLHERLLKPVMRSLKKHESVPSN